MQNIAIIFAVVAGLVLLATSPAAFVILLSIVVVIAVIRARSTAADKRERRDKLEAWLIAFVNHHAAALGLERARRIKTDRYGVLHTKEWDAEKAYFLNSVLMPALRAAGFGEPADEVASIAIPMIELRSAATRASAALAPVEAKTPVDFELQCAEMIRRHGWSARTTKGSGDQGIDIIAERDGVKIVFQCKLYSKPVGNSAVQEIAAGRAFERAQVAAVLSNQAYTNGARELAKANRVALLHPAHLPAFLARVEAKMAERVRVAA